jgi:hypothetical protein
MTAEQLTNTTMVTASYTQRLDACLGEPSMISIRVCLKPEVIIFIKRNMPKPRLKRRCHPLKEVAFSLQRKHQKFYDDLF